MEINYQSVVADHSLPRFDEGWAHLFEFNRLWIDKEAEAHWFSSLFVLSSMGLRKLSNPAKATVSYEPYF